MKNVTWNPISLESEQCVLGAILLNNDAYVRVCDIVTAADFSEAIHQKIFGLMAQMIDAGQKVSLITIKAFIDDHNFGEITVGQYLARLCAEATTIVNAPDYAKVVREMADRRRIADIARALFPAADTDAGQLATEAIEALDEVARTTTSAALPAVSMGSALDRAVEGIAKAYESGNRIIGIPTGLKDIDNQLGGLHPGHLVIIGGRPGMGKSALLSCLLLNAAKKGHRSMVASLEMSAEELAERMISDTIFDFPCDNVPYSNLRTGTFHENMFQYVKDAAEINRALPIRIEEQPGLTMSQIATRARRMKRSPEGLDLLAIDHLDLVKPSGRYQGNKVYELGEITAAAKALAKELKIPVVLLCQLNRGVEQREDRRPVLSDLRSSGSIEQDADVVIFLYREEYYLQHNKPKADTPEELQWVEKMADAKKKLTAIIAKQRMGPTGPVDLFCDIASNAVRDLGERQ
jgi:replicative DNA helicase